MKTQKELNSHLLTELKNYKEKFKEYKKYYETEKNTKNGLYFFIVKKGMFQDLEKFELNTDYNTIDYHYKTLKQLMAILPENSD